MYVVNGDKWVVLVERDGREVCALHNRKSITKDGKTSNAFFLAYVAGSVETTITFSPKFSSSIGQLSLRLLQVVRKSLVFHVFVGKIAEAMTVRDVVGHGHIGNK